jgi:hypothetical protein
MIMFISAALVVSPDQQGNSNKSSLFMRLVRRRNLGVIFLIAY